jgi:hypothetical protein
MTSAPGPTDILCDHLADSASSFAIGVPAAVGEFMRRPDESFEVAADGLTVVTPRGGIRVAPRDDLRPVACEQPSRRPGRWLQSLAFCLPDAAAGMAGRRVLSALGPDAAALSEPNRAAELFDLGVGAPHVAFCVRTPDPALADRLHAHCGRALAEWPGDLLAALAAADPHRVVLSALGRIEVTAPIPRARTPLGPHTHLFPDKLGAAEDPDLAPPAGWLCCLRLYPPHPQMDLAGDPIPFDRARHAAFQALLAHWGEPAYLAAKAGAERALRETGKRSAAGGAGEGPAAWATAVAAEVAERQWRAAANTA